MSSSNSKKVVQNLPTVNGANIRLNIPPNATLPTRWSRDPSTLHKGFDSYFEPEIYGLPRATPIAVARDDFTYLMDCDSQYMVFNALSDGLYRIDHPTELGDILKILDNSGLRTTELHQLPIASDYVDTRGWSFDAEILQTLLTQVPLQNFGFSHVLPVTGLRDDGVLLFRHDWNYYIWREDSLHRVDMPATPEDIVSVLIEEGFSSSSTLKTTLVNPGC